MNSLYQAVIDANNPVELRAVLKAYLQAQADAYEKSPDLGPKIAYELAGMLSLETIRQLPPADAYIKILAMAVDLELPESHRSSSVTWSHMVEKIRQL